MIPAAESPERTAAPRVADRATPRPGLSAVERDELVAWFAARAEPAYRADQVSDALWRSHVGGVAEVSTLPERLRGELASSYRFDTLDDAEVHIADGGLTQRVLHRLGDGVAVESVLMRYPRRETSRPRATLCVSSQAGCAVGCPFCATGELGFERDLEVAEIVDQARLANRRLRGSAWRLTNVVFMGMGEPFLNLDRVLAAARVLTDPWRLGLGARRITLSTSGVVPAIRRLTALRLQYGLAVSLHAARNSLRDVLVPLNRRWPVEELVAAASDHAEATGRRVSYEYVMISGINDSAADLAALIDLLAGRGAHVNLIPMNPVAHTPWEASSPSTVRSFAARLTAGGVPATIRRNRGQEIGAACGQLAAERAGEPPPAAVARRRQRLEAESAAALAGRRNRTPVPSAVG